MLKAIVFSFLMGVAFGQQVPSLMENGITAAQRRLETLPPLSTFDKISRALR
ncbi:MAG: hypothetical protein J0G99_04775 [Alphaproteobacteria bacterium]|nr:hypothetical protein [Alphaproteobacteria bacterium]